LPRQAAVGLARLGQHVDLKANQLVEGLYTISILPQFGAFLDIAVNNGTKILSVKVGSSVREALALQTNEVQEHRKLHGVC
jgi:hypothetical protein